MEEITFFVLVTPVVLPNATFPLVSKLNPSFLSPSLFSGCQCGETCQRLPLHHSKPGKDAGVAFNCCLAVF